MDDRGRKVSAIWDLLRGAVSMPEAERRTGLTAAQPRTACDYAADGTYTSVREWGA